MCVFRECVSGEGSVANLCVCENVLLIIIKWSLKKLSLVCRII